MGKATLFTHLKACAEAAKGFTNTLVANAVNAVTEALEEMNEIKANKPESVSLTIPTSGWQEDSSPAYSQYVDISVPGVTADDRVIVVISVEDQELAASCKMCRTCETLEGVIRIRAESVPVDAIQAEYWLDQGRSE